MKTFLLRLFTWWNSQTFGTQWSTFLYGEFPGAPLSTAGVGTRIAWLSVSTRILILTNSLGTEGLVVVGESGAQGDRPGAGRHLIAERVDSAGRDLAAVVAGVCRDGELRALNRSARPPWRDRSERR